MASEGVEKSDARICNTRAVKNLCLIYLSITPPDLSMMLVWTYSVDPLSVDIFNILPGFLWQPLLNSLYWYKDIVRCTHLVSRILQHGCKCSSWLKVNKISNQTVHHQSATKLDSMMNYSLENRIWRQTSGWVTCAKPSRQYTDPGVSYTFSRRFFKPKLPKIH